MGLLDFFDDKKKSGGSGGNNNNNRNRNNNNNNNNNNPLANIRKNLEQLGKPSAPKMKGPGHSLGGAKPGTVCPIRLDQPGSLGVRVERRSNHSASAIVSAVVEGSQAEAAGLVRGDVLCVAGSNGQDEMPYAVFLDLARSPQRPICEWFECVCACVCAFVCICVCLCVLLCSNNNTSSQIKPSPIVSLFVNLISFHCL